MPFAQNGSATITNSGAGPEGPNVGHKVTLIRKSDVDHPDHGPMWTVKRADGGNFEIMMYGKAVGQPTAQVPESWMALA